MQEKKELSQLAKQLLSGSGTVEMFTQSEFDDALAIGKAEIMKVAIDTTKTAIRIERSECAKVVREWKGDLDLDQIADAIDNRLASQVSQ
jgi:peptide subunit release factor 1 (eRF1)